MRFRIMMITISEDLPELPWSRNSQMGCHLRCTGLLQNAVVCVAGNLFFYFLYGIDAGNLGRTVLFPRSSVHPAAIAGGYHDIYPCDPAESTGHGKWTGLAAQAVITVAVFMFIYSAQSGFYWYNGGVHYVGMHGFGLLMLSVAICLERAEGRTATGLLFTASILLSMITAGSNFVTALQGLLSLLTILFISVVVEHRKRDCGCCLLRWYTL